MPSNPSDSMAPSAFGLFLASKDRLTRLALTVAAGSLVLALVAVLYAVRANRQTIYIAVLDPDDNVCLLPGKELPDAKGLHTRAAMIATSALLSRNPKDLDQPELLRGLLSKNALLTVDRIRELEAREFEERAMQQKPQVARIDAIPGRKGDIQVQVTGEVTRWGVVQQAPFIDAIPFTLRLLLKPNRNFIELHQFPMVIESLDLNYANTNR